MTLSGTSERTVSPWRDPSRITIRVICWSTRIVGLLTIFSVIFPIGRRRLRHPLFGGLELPLEATVTTGVLAAAAGVGLILLAAGLRRRKRRAWQIAVLTTFLIALLHFAFHRESLHREIGGVFSLALLVALLINRRQFTAVADPWMGKWRAVRVFVQMVLGGILINFLILEFNRRHALVDHPSAGDLLRHAVLSLIGVPGPVHFRPYARAWDDLTSAIGLVFGIGAVLLGGYYLLRSAEPKPSLGNADEARIRQLLAAYGGQDSLGYFALRRDKSVVVSPTAKSLVAYRVLAGVALVSGDPLGDLEAWPGAIEQYLAICQRNGWTPAVLGCSERGATVWSRYGLTVLELGDEAVVDAETFTLDGRKMRGVRQAVAKVRRAGYDVRVRRSKDISEPDYADLAQRVEQWRGTDTERGFSMALSRLADASDPECVLVTAEQDGVVRGMIQFVPWGQDGLSLDLMRRDRDADNGLNEFMISELLLMCRDIGVRQVSLNFAVFRAALERGERIGAGPIARLWAKVLRLGSRWWQIETLYRFNAKFRPSWFPRFVAYSGVRDLPRIALAAMEAEGFGGRPPALLRMLRRT